MVIDCMEHLIHYIPEQYKAGIMDFVSQLSPDMAEESYVIYGTHVFAKVMSYDTKDSGDCRIEAHNCYIDIQASITGAEGIAVFDRKILRVEQDYSQKDDNIFFYQDEHMPYAVNRNIPGMFSMIFPHEAHRPQQKADGYEGHVKKFVIKLETNK